LTIQSVQTGSVERDRVAAQATTDTISRALLANIATLPVPTSSSGFVYQLNPELGTVERATKTFGPFFVERAQTAGRGQASAGVTFEHLRFTSLDGRSRRDGTFVTTANKFTDETTPFDVDQLTLNIDASVATFYGNVGVTDRLEVGVAAPFVRLSVAGARVDTYRGRQFTQATASAEAVGLADIIARAKYTLYHAEGDGVAAAVDFRLPTGREEDLLGAGSAAVKFSGIGSIERGPLAAHVNGGVSFGGLARELAYDAAIEVAATAKTTIIGELLGRTIDSPGHIVQVSAPNPPSPASSAAGWRRITRCCRFFTFVPGFKWNLSSTWILAANVSIPLTSGGLNADYTVYRVGLHTGTLSSHLNCSVARVRSGFRGVIVRRGRFRSSSRPDLCGA
jgi:hypothetical protein